MELKKEKAEVIRFQYGSRSIILVKLENGDTKIATLSARFLRHPSLFKAGKIITVIIPPYDNERVIVHRDTLLDLLDEEPS